MAKSLSRCRNHRSVQLILCIRLRDGGYSQSAVRGALGMAGLEGFSLPLSARSHNHSGSALWPRCTDCQRQMSR
eukprot:42608-Prymnesium_polylepis.2